MQNSNRTSGHLKVEILNGPLDTSKLKFESDLWTPKQKNERARCPEVGLGILARIIRRSVEHMKRMQNSLVFLGFQARRHIRGDIETEHDQRDRSHKHFSKIHLEKSRFV